MTSYVRVDVHIVRVGVRYVRVDVRFCACGRPFCACGRPVRVGRYPRVMLSLRRPLTALETHSKTD